MDIGSGTGFPSASLSNFAPHVFVIDDIECASMESFLQSLKFSSPEMQAEVCKLVGKAAKFKGKKSGGVHRPCFGEEKKSSVTVRNIKIFLTEHFQNWPKTQVFSEHSLLHAMQH